MALVEIAKVWCAPGTLKDRDSTPASPMAGYKIESSICLPFGSFMGGIRLNLWFVVNLPAPVVQLDRATASGAVGCGFEPRRAQLTLKMRVTARLRKPVSPRLVGSVAQSVRACTLISAGSLVRVQSDPH